MNNTEIVNKLIGSIRPLGDASRDGERFENLVVMCELANDLITQIDAVAYDYKDSYEASVIKSRDYAKKFLSETIGVAE